MMFQSCNGIYFTLHDLAGNKSSLPKYLDGGSLKSVFEKGNDGNVDRSEKRFCFSLSLLFRSTT